MVCVYRMVHVKYYKLFFSEIVKDGDKMARKLFLQSLLRLFIGHRCPTNLEITKKFFLLQLISLEKKTLTFCVECPVYVVVVTNSAVTP